MEAARGESVTRANFPKSSPSWSVHTTPCNTGNRTRLHTHTHAKKKTQSLDTNTVYSAQGLKKNHKVAGELRTGMNRHVPTYVCPQWRCEHVCAHEHVLCIYSTCVVCECVYAYSALSHLIIVMTHGELSTACQTPLLVFPSSAGHTLLVWWATHFNPHHKDKISSSECRETEQCSCVKQKRADGEMYSSAHTLP